jgi:hypothetical protein
MTHILNQLEKQVNFYKMKQSIYVKLRTNIKINGERLHLSCKAGKFRSKQD